MTRPLSRSRSFLAASGLLLALATVPSLSARQRGDDAKSLFDISLPLTALAALGGTMTLSCDTDNDRDMTAMIRALERQGARGRYEWTEDDGDRMVATRDGGRFRLFAKEEDGDAVTLEMPWKVAQCLLSGENAGRRKIRVEDLRRDGGFRLKVNGEDANLSVNLR